MNYLGITTRDDAQQAPLTEHQLTNETRLAYFFPPVPPPFVEEPPLLLRSLTTSTCVV